MIELEFYRFIICVLLGALIGTVVRNKKEEKG